MGLGEGAHTQVDINRMKQKRDEKNESQGCASVLREEQPPDDMTSTGSYNMDTMFRLVPCMHRENVMIFDNMDTLGQ